MNQTVVIGLQKSCIKSGYLNKIHCNKRFKAGLNYTIMVSVQNFGHQYIIQHTSVYLPKIIPRSLSGNCGMWWSAAMIVTATYICSNLALWTVDLPKK